MQLGFTNPLQNATDALKVSQGASSAFEISPAQLMFREFQTIAIAIDSEAQCSNRHLYHEWSSELTSNILTSGNFKKLIIFQLEKRGYTVIPYEGTQIYISW